MRFLPLVNRGVVSRCRRQIRDSQHKHVEGFRDCGAERQGKAMLPVVESYVQSLALTILVVG
jgi:hypothetical protein